MCRVDGESIEAMRANPINPPLLAVGTSAGRVVLVDSSKVQNKNVHFKRGMKNIKTDMRVVEHESASQVHADAISALTWTSGNRFASASFDHNIRISDIENFKETFNIHLKDMVATAIDYYPKSSLLLTGFEDGYIRTFDEREKSKKAISLYKSHSRWISRLAFLPSDSNIFASVDNR